MYSSSRLTGGSYSTYASDCCRTERQQSIYACLQTNKDAYKEDALLERQAACAAGNDPGRCSPIAHWTPALPISSYR